MRRIAVWVAALAGLAGCKESPAVAEVLAFESAMCACKDVACADAQRSKIIDWHKANRATMVSDDEQAKITDAMARATTCLEALRPPPAPASEAGGAPATEAPTAAPAEAPAATPAEAPAAAPEAPAAAEPRPAEE